MNERIGDVVLVTREIIKKLSEIDDTQFGVGTFSDESDANDGFENKLSLTEDSETAIDVAKLLRTEDGRDMEEANLAVLHKIAVGDSVGWRKGSRKIIVMFGGSPGHEPTCIEGSPITRYSVVQDLKAKKISLFAVDLGNMDASTRSWPLTGCGGELTGTDGQTSFITERSGGLKISGSKEVLIEKLIDEVVDQI